MPPISSFNRVEINLGAIKANCQAVKRLISDKMMAVIKGDAYGHGLVECGWALASIKVGRIGVLDLDEALALQKAGVPGRFYVLAGLQGTAQSAKAVEAGVTVLAYRWEQLADLDKAAKKADRPVRVMLKMDTGMGRLGFSWREGPEVIAKAAKLEGAVVEGLATHLATSGDQEARTQLKRFNELKAVADKIFPEQLTHSALASGGVLAHPDYRDDMSRVGLMLYGYSPLPESHRALFDLSTSRALIRSLKPAMTLKSQILAIKTAKVGDTVSYDRTYAAQKDTPVATVPIGYVHGVSRTRSGKGHAIIGGRTANLLGRVCMNLTMYDVSQIAVLPGQEAVLLGRQGGEVVTAYQLAEWEDTSVYEVLCLAGRLNPRVFVEH